MISERQGTRTTTMASSTVVQRYYASTLGRFTSPDPYGGSADGKDPQSWNRYSYVQDDPVNHNDPSGMYMPFWDDWGVGGWGYNWITAGGDSGWGSQGPFYSCGDGSQWLPNPVCYAPLFLMLAPPSAQKSKPTCADKYGIPSDAAVPQIEVLLGEDSWPWKVYSRGEVRMEELMMEQVMYNYASAKVFRAGATEEDVNSTIETRTYNGLPRGRALLPKALGSAWDSDLCAHLQSAWGAHDDFWSSSKHFSNVNQWRGIVGPPGPGQFRLAGTIFSHNPDAFYWPRPPRSVPPRTRLPGLPGRNR